MGNPSRAKAARNASENRSDVASRWMYFVVKHTNTLTYPFLIRQAQAIKLLISNGPAKSTPVYVNGLEKVTRSVLFVDNAYFACADDGLYKIL